MLGHLSSFWSLLNTQWDNSQWKVQIALVEAAEELGPDCGILWLCSMGRQQTSKERRLRRLLQNGTLAQDQRVNCELYRWRGWVRDNRHRSVQCDISVKSPVSIILFHTIAFTFRENNKLDLMGLDSEHGTKQTGRLQYIGLHWLPHERYSAYKLFKYLDGQES